MLFKRRYLRLSLIQSQQIFSSSLSFFLLFYSSACIMCVLSPFTSAFHGVQCVITALSSVENRQCCRSTLRALSILLSFSLCLSHQSHSLLLWPPNKSTAFLKQKKTHWNVKAEEGSRAKLKRAYCEINSVG